MGIFDISSNVNSVAPLDMFNKNQRQFIEACRRMKLNIDAIMNPKMPVKVMAIIRDNVILDDLDASMFTYHIFRIPVLKHVVHIYSMTKDPESIKPFFEIEDLTEEQFFQLNGGIRDGVDISVYNYWYFNSRQMYEIRMGLKEGLDVSIYAKRHMSAKQMHCIRMCMLNKLDFTPLLGRRTVQQINKVIKEYNELFMIDIEY